MRVLIMAAGVGSRIGNKSKGFLILNNEPIIGRMIRQLVQYGVGPIYVVIGHEAERFTNLKGVLLIPNPDYKTGDNAQGLRVALDLIGYEDTLILDADVVLDEGALQPLLDSYKKYRDSVSLVDLSFDEEEAMKLVIQDGRILEYSKEHGVGAEICTLVTTEVLRDIYPDLPHLRWWGVGVGKGKLIPRFAEIPKNTKWIEIDTPEDYEKAKELFES
jgi:choline kinase